MLNIDHKTGYVQGWQGCRLKLHQTVVVSLVTTICTLKLEQLHPFRRDRRVPKKGYVKNC